MSTLKLKRTPQVFEFSESEEVVESFHSRALSPDEINALTSQKEVNIAKDDHDERIIVMEVALQFPDRDRDDFAQWFIRARSALTHFRIASHRLKRRAAALNREQAEARKAASDVVV